MKTFNKNIFKKDAERLGYEDAIIELFGNDVVMMYDFSMVHETTSRVNMLTKKFSMIPLWYLQFLIDKSPAKIVDVGCGGNLFKPVIKKLFDIPVHGIDPRNPAADEVDFFDSDFSQGHTKQYESAFSINALHFIPLLDLTKVVREFYNIIAIGGRGFLALNSARMVEKTKSDWFLQVFNCIKPTPKQIQDYIRDQLYTLDIDFLVTDLLIVDHPDDFLDGNIRMVFNK
jgi:hypothetical protein